MSRHSLRRWHEMLRDRIAWGFRSPAWGVSLVLHLGLMLLVSLVTYAVPMPFVLTFTTPPVPLDIPPESFHFDQEVVPEIGTLSAGGVGTALASAPELSDISEVSLETELDPWDQGDIEFSRELEVATTPLNTSTKLVRGLAGVGVTGAEGAIDRLTHEIMLSLEDADTLVVWLFDQSASLTRQRAEIHDRLERIYDELGVLSEGIQSQERRAPLLTAVMQFGQRASWVLEKPTSNVSRIQEAIRSIQLDGSGVENVFSAIYAAADRFRRLRSRRNVMLIVVSDEVGDDQATMLEKTVDLCRANTIPVYVVGVPAAFGQSETYLKWVDPNPKFDQTPRWGRVNQGPESLLPEVLNLPFGDEDESAIDSGFGPFALTRICVQTNGIYFTIHPNRDANRRLRRHETSDFSAYFAHFFDPQRMRPYRPDYVSASEYQRQVRDNSARAAVVSAARLTVQRMADPRREFLNRDSAQFVRDLTEAQKVAAKLEPKVKTIFELLKRGEEARLEEEMLRWQAAYDLAYGQALAVVVRTRGYNEMLAKAKRGMEPENPDSNTWTLVPTDDVTTSGRLSREAEAARDYLERVQREHEGTPWAMLAKRELSVPFGWKWEESYTPLPEEAGTRNNNVNANVNRPLRDERRRMLKRPPRREIPKL